MHRGSFCQSDGFGRPTWLVFEWISAVWSLSTAVTPLSTHIATYRGLILHELFHTLGFSNSMFLDARGSDGSRKALLKLKQVIPSRNRHVPVMQAAHPASRVDCR